MQQDCCEALRADRCDMLDCLADGQIFADHAQEALAGR